MEFGGILRKSARFYSDNVAVTCEGQSLTFAELYERSCRLANGLRALGLEKGDRVATLEDNNIESLVEICAFALAGLVRCPMYTQNTGDVHVYMLNLVGAKALMAQEKYVKDVADLLSTATTVEHVVVNGAGGDGMLAYDDVVGSPSEDPNVLVRQDDNHIIRFSAGTTGRPKGILHTVRGWRDMGSEFALVLPRTEPDDAYLCAAPLSHAAGLFVWPFISQGARHVLMPAFDPGRFLELVETERCTLTLLVPTMIQIVANHPDAKKRDVSSLKAVFYGAAPIAERTLEEAQALWGNIMYQLYGQSESLPVCVLDPRYHSVGGTAEERRLLRSCGRPTPNTLVKLVDDDGNEVPQGELGEICTLSPGNMQEIWADPEATAERTTPDGYVRSRDVGSMDDSGFIFLADRKEDLIISGGFNIWPAEVENALCSHPAVMEAAVVGVPDEKWGETVMAVVVLRDGQQATADELVDWCREKVGSTKKPTRVEFSAEPLPKSGVGKLLRRTVREAYWTAEDRGISGA